MDLDKIMNQPVKDSDVLDYYLRDTLQRLSEALSAAEADNMGAVCLNLGRAYSGLSHALTKWDKMRLG